ncbi:hypothetical protein C8F01DRAFT_1260221 [Mycena amicta]|nr:hypothetical protein C8F01DRAFT_1260221 [Mycena amicta]
MGRRRKQKNSTFVFNDTASHPAADYRFHFGENLETIASVSNVTPQKRVRLEDDLSVDQYADFIPPSLLQGDDLASVADTLTATEEVYHHFIEDDEVSHGKRDRYESSDNPMAPWRRRKDEILDHLLRHDGLGQDTYHPACRFCDAAYGQDEKIRIFRCQDCGVFLQCESCLKERHELTPLHVIKEWNGDFWDDVALHRTHLNDNSPKSLQGCYQLGHRGRACLLARPKRQLVVIDTNGVFTLNVQECGCSQSLRYDLVAQLMGNRWYPATISELGTCATFRVLDLFRQLNVVGNVSAYHFVGTLERLTDPTGLGSTPPYGKAIRLPETGETRGSGPPARRVEREGRGGEQDFNLPADWDKCSPDDEFLYALMLALDANFRLKNRIRANERQDPSLGPGWGCFVDDGPYKDHLRNYVVEEDISTCIAFTALMQKDTKLTTGLRVSGVGGCVCARHGVVRPQGLGDLQKGECYANMDYIFMHALGDARVKRLVVSYDIACQWKINLRTRVLNILDGSTFAPNLDAFDTQFGLPVWHAAVHEESCQAANSLSYIVGAGRTDGEGIERTWAILNPIGFATKEMGEGNRHDTIDDKVDHINFEKNVGQGDALTRKLIIAVAERDKQIAEFMEVDSSLNPEVRQDWQRQVREWLADKTKPNPYVMAGGKDAGPSEAQVAAELKEAEVKEAREGRAEFVEGRTTAAAFVKALLQLEDLKRRIKNEVKGSSSLTADRASQIDELRASFFKKLKVIQQQQDFFMPGVASLRLAEEELRDGDRLPPKAEDVKLWFPSDLGETERGRACKRGLLDVEAKLRRAQCGDALGRIRSLLYTKTHLIHHRNANSVGQRATTRSGTLIGRVTDRIAREVTKYKQAWRALRCLMGPDYAPQFRELLAEDVCVRIEEESDAGARLRLGRVGAGRRARNEPTQAKGSGAVSWIWWAVRDDDDKIGLHEAVRVRWAKTLARRDRWIEEVRLLRAEMKRVLRSLLSVQREWQEQANCGRLVEPELAAGLTAYAKRQIAVHRWIAERFVAGWNKPGKAVVEAVMREDLSVYQRLVEGDDDEAVMAEGGIAQLEAMEV